MRRILTAGLSAALSAALIAPVAWADPTPPPDDTPLPRDAAPPPPPDNPDRGAPETPQRDDKVSEPRDSSPRWSPPGDKAPEPQYAEPHFPQPGDPAPDPGPISVRPDDKPRPAKPKLDEAAGGVAGAVLGQVAGTAAGGPVGGIAASMVGSRLGGAAVRVGKRVLGIGGKPQDDLPPSDDAAYAGVSASAFDRDPVPAGGPS